MKKENLKKLFSKENTTILLLVVLYAVVAVMLYTNTASRQLSNMLISLSCYIVLAVSLNLVVGFLGELSLGHASFMSVGLFSGCLVSIATANLLPLAVRLPLSMVIGGVFAAVVGFVVGLPALRLRGDYLAIVTLACGEIINNAINNFEFTGGALGLNTAAIYSDPKTLLPFAFVLVIFSVIVLTNFVSSRQGRAVKAIRDNLIAAESTGVDITFYKLLVFVMAAFFAGMAGTLYGHSLANIKASTFDYNMSIEILVIVVLGGMKDMRGAVIAAILLRALPEMLRGFSDYRMLIYSVLLIVIMLVNNSEHFAGLKDKLNFSRFMKKTPALADAKEDGHDE